MGKVLTIDSIIDSLFQSMDVVYGVFKCNSASVFLEFPEIRLRL